MKDEPVLEGQTVAEAADYIAEVSGHLAAMARRQQLDVLAHLLEMTRLEAQHVTLTEGGAASVE